MCINKEIIHLLHDRQAFANSDIYTYIYIHERIAVNRELIPVEKNKGRDGDRIRTHNR